MTFKQFLYKTLAEMVKWSNVLTMESPLTFALALLSLACLWGLIYWRPRRKLWAAARLIPGPKPLPLIGNAMLFWGDILQVLPKLLELRTKFGTVGSAWLGGRLMVLLADPEDIQCVLGNARITNRDRNFSLAMMTFFGNGLLANADEVWKAHRKLLTPMFHLKVLESYVEVFGEKAKMLMDKLDEVADGTPFDINKKLCLCTLDAICETVVGLQTNTQEQGYSDFQRVHYQATELVHRRVVYPWLLVPWIYPFTGDGRRAKAVVKSFDAFNSDVIARKLAAYRQGARRAGVETASGKKITSFLDMLIEASETQGSILTEKEIMDEVTTMTAAGLITTSITMAVLLLLIAIHPEWQDALFAEMSKVFVDDMTRPATYLDLPKMEVLDRVIRETMRMFPVVPLLARSVTEDVVLPSGYTLPAGSSAVIVNYIVQRDPKYYSDPNKFQPDRWLPESASEKHRYAYLPFSAGFRNCIGQKYALLQMKSILSQLVRRFKVTTALKMEDLQKLEMSFIIRLRSGGYQLKLEKREGVHR